MTQLKQKQDRAKICEQCQQVIFVAFRIRQSKTKDWIFVCKSCCEKSADMLGYQYGGTWKGKKR